MVTTEDLMGAPIRLDDPFSMDNITSIQMYKFSGDWTAKVEFGKGGTKGVQEMKATTFPEAVEKLRSFLEYIEKLSG